MAMDVFIHIIGRWRLLGPGQNSIHSGPDSQNITMYSSVSCHSKKVTFKLRSHLNKQRLRKEEGEGKGERKAVGAEWAMEGAKPQPS